jgi:peptide deformylase
MYILKVARMGHPVLRAKARQLEKSEIRGAVIQKLIDDMLDTMAEYHGVGLAAPQVHEGLRLFVAALDPGDGDDEEDIVPIALINPEITVVGTDVVEDWEGCLSIPDIRGRVPRAREVKVRALDRNGSRIELSASDFSARVIQHETDHLDGVLFFDRMTSLASMTFLDDARATGARTRTNPVFFSSARSDCRRSSSTLE